MNPHIQTPMVKLLRFILMYPFYCVCFCVCVSPHNECVLVFVIQSDKWSTEYVCIGKGDRTCVLPVLVGVCGCLSVTIWCWERQVCGSLWWIKDDAAQHINNHLSSRVDDQTFIVKILQQSCVFCIGRGVCLCVFPCYVIGPCECVCVCVTTWCWVR